MAIIHKDYNMYIKKFNPMMLLLLISLAFTQFSLAKPANQLNADVDAAIKKFEREVEVEKNFFLK